MDVAWLKINSRAETRQPEAIARRVRNCVGNRLDQPIPGQSAEEAWSSKKYPLELCGRAVRMVSEVRDGALRSPNPTYPLQPV